MNAVEDNKEITKTQTKSVVEKNPTVDDEDDFPLPVCTIRPGDDGFETCESCQ